MSSLSQPRITNIWDQAQHQKNTTNTSICTVCVVHFAHSTSPHLKPLASNVNERQLIKISVHLEIDGCVWRPGGRSAVLFMPVYLLSYRPHTLWPSATKEQQAGCTFSLRTYCLFCCLRAKHLHSARWKPRGWPTYVLPSYILYTLHSDTQDIFAQVTSGDSYHLFTACTPFWTSTNVDCDPTVADTAVCLPAFLPSSLPSCLSSLFAVNSGVSRRPPALHGRGEPSHSSEHAAPELLTGNLYK